MANLTLKPDMILKRAGVVFHNNAVLIRQANRQYDDSNTLGGQKNGGAIRIRLPNKYLTQTGANLASGTALDTTEQSITLPAGTQRHVDTNFSTSELTLDMEVFATRILEPGISTLAAMVDCPCSNVLVPISFFTGERHVMHCGARPLRARRSAAIAPRRYR